jgi:hypothetical protein
MTTITGMTICELQDFVSAFKIKNGHIQVGYPSIVQYSNGDVYKGEINEKGIKYGLGEMYFENGDVFAARWANDVANGCGIYMCIDGTTYKGNWKHGVFNGKNNAIMFSNGDIYVGGISNTLFNGIGKMCYHDGEIYVGSFLLGYKCGYGIAMWENGDTYKGYWDLDELNGNGTLDACNTLGLLYTGPWLNGCQQQEGEILCVH